MNEPREWLDDFEKMLKEKTAFSPDLGDWTYNFEYGAADEIKEIKSFIKKVEDAAYEKGLKDAVECLPKDMDKNFTMRPTQKNSIIHIHWESYNTALFDCRTAILAKQSKKQRRLTSQQHFKQKLVSSKRPQRQRRKLFAQE